MSRIVPLPPLPGPSSCFAIAAFTVCIVVMNASAVIRAAPSVPPLQPAKKTHTVNYSGDSSHGNETPQGEIITIEGNVKFVSEDTTMLTDLATYNNTTGVANSPGKLRLDDPKDSVAGDKGVAYYKPRDAKITGNVVITVKPKAHSPGAASNSARGKFDAPATIYCDNLDYNWHTHIATMTGGLTLKYKDYTVTADKAVYYSDEERVHLIGNMHYTRANRRDTGKAPEATAILTEDKEQFTIPRTPDGVNGTAEVDDEDVPGSSTKPSPVPAASPASSPTAQPAAKSTAPAAPPPAAGTKP